MMAPPPVFVIICKLYERDPDAAKAIEQKVEERSAIFARPPSNLFSHLHTLFSLILVRKNGKTQDW